MVGARDPDEQLDAHSGALQLARESPVAFRGRSIPDEQRRRQVVLDERRDPGRRARPAPACARAVHGSGRSLRHRAGVIGCGHRSVRWSRACRGRGRARPASARGPRKVFPAVSFCAESTAVSGAAIETARSGSLSRVAVPARNEAAASRTIRVCTQTSPSGCHSGSCGAPRRASSSGKKRSRPVSSSTANPMEGFAARSSSFLNSSNTRSPDSSLRSSVRHSATSSPSGGISRRAASWATRRPRRGVFGKVRRVGGAQHSAFQVPAPAMRVQHFAGEGDRCRCCSP